MEHLPGVNQACTVANQSSPKVIAKAQTATPPEQKKDGDEKLCCTRLCRSGGVGGRFRGLSLHAREVACKGLETREGGGRIKAHTARQRRDRGRVA